LRDDQALIDRNLRYCNFDGKEKQGNICMKRIKSSHNRMLCQQPPGKRARREITSAPEVLNRRDFSKTDFLLSYIAVVSRSELSRSETGNKEVLLQLALKQFVSQRRYFEPFQKYRNVGIPHVTDI